MSFIIESIHAGGLVHSPYDELRRTRPRSGDWVRWPEFMDGKHRVSLGRIWEVGTGYVGPDEVHVCEEPGRAFLLDDGQVDIGGGPFRVVKRADLIPTHECHTGQYWNWGNNRRGRDQGVDYMIARPIFDYRPRNTP